MGKPTGIECIIPDCHRERASTEHGLCAAHMYRKLKGYDLDRPISRTGGGWGAHKCHVDTCPGHHKPRATCGTKSERNVVSRLHRDHGIDATEYARLVDLQGGGCAICGGVNDDKNGKYRRLAVDHDHGCCPVGRSCSVCFRGLLCHKCNVGLGHFNDSLDLLFKAVEYMMRTGDNQ